MKRVLLTCFNITVPIRAACNSSLEMVALPFFGTSSFFAIINDIWYLFLGVENLQYATAPYAFMLASQNICSSAL